MVSSRTSFHLELREVDTSWLLSTKSGQNVQNIVFLKTNARSGWDVFGNLYWRAKGIIIGKASCRVLTFLRDFVGDFIRDFDLRILFKSRLALHNKREFITYFARRWETRVFITRPKREKAEEIVKVSVSFSLALPTFPSVFPDECLDFA